MKQFRTILMMSFCNFAAAGVLFAQDKSSEAADSETVSAAQVQSWIEQLSHPDFHVRQQAVGRLYAAGPAVLKQLDQLIQESNDFEAVLRAKALINRIQQLYLVGAQVKLEVDKKEVRWDEPFTLRVTLTNPSDFPILMPFLIEDRQKLDINPLAVQVGQMLDALDFLAITGPNGEAVDLTVSDYRGYPELKHAIETRATAEPASLLQPKQSVTLELAEFNRGFARVRMFDAGEYQIRFAYLPAWDDPQLVENEIGLVTSNTVTVRVTKPAPDLIRQAGRPLLLSLKRENDQFVVSLTNTYDLPMGVNLNLGGLGLNRHARLRWQAKRDHQSSYAYDPFPEAPPFSADHFKTLAPLETIPIHKATVEDLRGIRLFDSFQAGESVDVTVTYSNAIDRSSLTRITDKAEAQTETFKSLIESMPALMFTGQVTSESVTITLPDAALGAS